MEHKLPELNYAYDALEPHIDAKTMEIHHSKHHQAYVNKYVDAINKYSEWAEKPVEEVLRNLYKVPEDIKTAVRNNGGGYFNHSLFWEIMTPNAKDMPEGKLLEAIKRDFGSFEAMKEAFNQAAATRFGSGWAWLVLTAEKKLRVTSSPNQDVPFSEGEPLLLLDVWEHAYYLKYQNKRPDYINAFWNVVNWDKVTKHYEKAL